MYKSYIDITLVLVEIGGGGGGRGVKLFKKSSIIRVKQA